MRITIETDEMREGAKAAAIVTPDQTSTSGGAAPASTTVSDVRRAQGEPMHIDGGRAPTLAPLIRQAGTRYQETAPAHPGAMVTDAGPAPDLKAHAAHAAEEAQPAGENAKKSPKHK